MKSKPQGRRPQNEYSKRGLPVNRALRYLRESRGLTRSEVVELAAARGERLSDVYLTEVERESKKPSGEKLDVILGTLGEDRSTFEDLLAERPWESQPTERRTRSFSRSDLKSSGYYQSLATPSSPGGSDGLTDLAPTPPAFTSRRRSAAPQGESLVQSFALSIDAASVAAPLRALSAESLGAPVYEPVDLRYETELEELIATYPKLTRNQQLTLVGLTRDWMRR